MPRKKSPGSRAGARVIQLSEQPKHSTPRKKKGPCWWFAQCDTYEDVQAIAAASGNLPPSELVLCLKDALVRAKHHKPSLVPYIALELDHAEAAWKWASKFDEERTRDLLAQKAWKRLCEAGLGDAAKRLLWEYATADDALLEVAKGSRHMARNLKALRRADRVAKERADDSRAEMFSRRSELAARDAAQSAWPFRNPYVTTLEDAAATYPVVGNLPSEEATAAVSKSGDAVRRFGAKILLAILRAGARVYDVDLSLGELVALATCANPGRGCPLDERSLRRFLKTATIREAEPAYAHLFSLAVRLSRPTSF